MPLLNTFISAGNDLSLHQAASLTKLDFEQTVKLKRGRVELEFRREAEFIGWLQILDSRPIRLLIRPLTKLLTRSLQGSL